MKKIICLVVAVLLLPTLSHAQSVRSPSVSTLGKGIIGGFLAKKSKPLVGGVVVGGTLAGGYLFYRHEHKGNQDIAEVSKWAVRGYGNPEGQQALQDLKVLINGHMFGPKYACRGLAEEAVETVFSFLYRFSDSDSWKLIEKQTTDFQEICPNLIPFGCDFGDWVFVFDYRDVKENPSVFLMRLDKEYSEGLLFVASSFDEFLVKLHV